MVQAVAGGRPGEMPAVKEEGWGQAGILGESVSVDGEKAWRSRKSGRRGCHEGTYAPIHAVFVSM